MNGWRVAVAALSFAALLPSASTPIALKLCALSSDFGKYRAKFVAVRGVYYYGLRDTCSQTCPDGPWPSFIELSGGADDTWNALEKIEQTVEADAKKGKRFEIRVTVIGQLKTQARLSPVGPCDRQGSGYFGYGHLGVFPAELVVQSFTDIEVIENPSSPYDYANLYRGDL